MKEIASLQHPLVKHWAKLQSDSAYRKEQKALLLEGKNCLQDVMKTHRAKRLIVTHPDKTIEKPNADEILVVTEAIIKKITQVESPEGILAEFSMPETRPLTKVNRLLVSDRIQDPGNLGTLIRSALAFGWDGLFLLPGSCDPFNSKAVRAAKGATFDLPLASGSWQELQAICQKNGLSLVVADLEGQPPSHFPQEKMALVLGNEANGANVPHSIPKQQVKLSMQGPMESLNVAVAGSILLYLFQGRP